MAFVAIPSTGFNDPIPGQEALIRWPFQVTRNTRGGLVPLPYVEPHGALYNLACRDEAVARPVARTAEEHNLAVMGLPGSKLEVVASGRCRFLAEGFADRRYRPDGSLVPRTEADAFVEDAEEAVRQAEWLLRERGVVTLFAHGNNPQAVAFDIARGVASTAIGYGIRPFAIGGG